jgi:hypothetical protein
MPRVKEEKMNDAESEIREIVDRETRGWDTQDVGLLLSVFHPDMVWPWPNSPTSHDPMEWRLVLGRYDHQRWGSRWRELFDTHELVHNRRRTRKIEVSKQAKRSPIARAPHLRLWALWRVCWAAASLS